MTFISFKQFLQEAPLSIDATDFGLSNADANKRFGEGLRKNKDCEKVEELDGGFALYRINRMFAVFYKDEPTVYYLMKFKTGVISIVNKRAATQIAVWASESYPASIAKRVFFEQLLPEYHLVATDGHQTESGARFWRNRVAEAQAKNLFVYFINQVSTPRKMVRIVSAKQFSDLVSTGEIWGTSTKFEGRKLLISDSPLQPKPDVDFED